MSLADKFILLIALWNVYILLWAKYIGLISYQQGDLQGIGQIMYCPKWVLHGVLSIVRGRVIAALFASLGCGYQSHSQEQSWNVWIVPRV
jgi:hypothetical protein